MPEPTSTYPGSVLSSILRHDAKVASYKIALLRALADIALAFPGLGFRGLAVAVPLVTIAEFWIAYYWAFADPQRPLLQGQRNVRNGTLTADMAFRDALEHLVVLWQEHVGSAFVPSDGYVAVSELRSERKRGTYPLGLLQAYDCVRARIAGTVQMPVRYAGHGGGQWQVFPKALRLTDVREPVEAHPAARKTDLCVLVTPELWRDFRRLSLWIEALAIHEWSLYTATLRQPDGSLISRGEVYQLLTDRPNNRRPLTWERNQIDILLLEGQTFECPWTHKRLVHAGEYDLDHIIPVSVYPMNEVWNLVPSDRHFNEHRKRDRLPSAVTMEGAASALHGTYSTYLVAHELARALRVDAKARFPGVPQRPEDLCGFLVRETCQFIERVAQARNLARF